MQQLNKVANFSANELDKIKTQKDCECFFIEKQNQGYNIEKIDELNRLLFICYANDACTVYEFLNLECNEIKEQLENMETALQILTNAKFFDRSNLLLTKFFDEFNKIFAFTAKDGTSVNIKNLPRELKITLIADEGYYQNFFETNTKYLAELDEELVKFRLNFALADLFKAIKTHYDSIIISKIPYNELTQDKPDNKANVVVNYEMMRSKINKLLMNLEKISTTNEISNNIKYMKENLVGVEAKKQAFIDQIKKDSVNKSQHISIVNNVWISTATATINFKELEKKLLGLDDVYDLVLTNKPSSIFSKKTNRLIEEKKDEFSKILNNIKLTTNLSKFLGSGAYGVAWVVFKNSEAKKANDGRVYKFITKFDLYNSTERMATIWNQYYGYEEHPELVRKFNTASSVNKMIFSAPFINGDNFKNSGLNNFNYHHTLQNQLRDLYINSTLLDQNRYVGDYHVGGNIKKINLSDKKYIYVPVDIDHLASFPEEFSNLPEVTPHSIFVNKIYPNIIKNIIDEIFIKLEEHNINFKNLINASKLTHEELIGITLSSIKIFSSKVGKVFKSLLNESDSQYQYNICMLAKQLEKKLKHKLSFSINNDQNHNFFAINSTVSPQSPIITERQQYTPQKALFFDAPTNQSPILTAPATDSQVTIKYSQELQATKIRNSGRLLQFKHKNEQSYNESPSLPNKNSMQERRNNKFNSKF